MDKLMEALRKDYIDGNCIGSEDDECSCSLTLYYADLEEYNKNPGIALNQEIYINDTFKNTMKVLSEYRVYLEDIYY